MIWFKDAPDRCLIEEAHRQCVAGRRSLSQEFECLSGLFGGRRSRAPAPHHRQYLLRRMPRSLIITRRRRARIPRRRPPTRIQVAAMDDEEEEESSYYEEEMPLERVVWQFPSPEPPPRRIKPTTTTPIKSIVADCEQEALIALWQRDEKTEKESLCARYREYELMQYDSDVYCAIVTHLEE